MIESRRDIKQNKQTEYFVEKGESFLHRELIVQIRINFKANILSEPSRSGSESFLVSHWVISIFRIEIEHSNDVTESILFFKRLETIHAELWKEIKVVTAHLELIHFIESAERYEANR